MPNTHILIGITIPNNWCDPLGVKHMASTNPIANKVWYLDASFHLIKCDILPIYIDMGIKGKWIAA